MGNKVHKVFTPELNLCYCDNIMGSKRSTQCSKTKECSHIHIRVISFIRSFKPAEEAVASMHLHLQKSRPISQRQLESVTIQL